MNRFLCLLLIWTCWSQCSLWSRPPAADPGSTGPALVMERLRAEVYLAGTERNGTKLLKGLRGIRDLQVRYGALDSALRTGIRIVSISGTADDRVAMARDWNVVANIYKKLGSLAEAVDAQKRCLIILRTTNQPKLVSPALLHLLDLLLASGRYEEFKHSSDEALLTFASKGDRNGRAQVLFLQGKCFTLQGRPADALSILHLALRDSAMMDVGTTKAGSFFALSKAYAGIKDWKAARSTFDTGILLDPRAMDQEPDLHGLCASIDEGMGDLAEALRCERLQAEAKDSVRGATNADHMVQLQALYAITMKDNDLSRLRGENQNTMMALASERWKVRMSTGFGLILLTLVLLLLLLRGKHLGTLRRARMKNALIHRQSDEIHSKNIALEQQNLRLMETLDSENEKDAVLKDVHHRTKNSMQLVSALLQMQGAYAQDPQLASLLHDCQGRIHSIALVHEHIYKCGDLNRVNVKAHFMALANAVLRHHGLSDQVTVEFDITHDRARLEELTPLSLLLNELLTNSAKHASSRDRSGRIQITLRPLAEHRCELLFTDEGTGLEQERFLRADSFSAELVRTLAKQLNGTIHLLKTEVITFQMTFDNADRDEMRLAS